LAAAPNSKEYGVPSLKMAWYGPARLAGNIGRNIFWPVPGVDSALVYFQRTIERDPALQQPTFTAIDQAFLQRRKTLRQALAGWAGSAAAAEEILVRAGVDPQARGEQLNIDQFIAIASAK
jgi:16S rRNA (adenine1518-N6/adenine1519-N6)-dimethyltransferase